MKGSELLRLGADPSNAKAICVFVHGRGQSPEEMVSHVLSRVGTDGVAYRLPRAARGAWYDARAIDPLTTTSRAQLDDALAQLNAAIAEARAEMPGRPLVLGGFSQGACLSIEYLCRGDNPPDALVALTGCRVGTLACERPNAPPRGTPVYLTGGDADPWIPVAAFGEAATALGAAGVGLRADIFPGRTHEVSDPEAAMLACVLDDLAAGRPPSMQVAR